MATIQTFSDASHPNTTCYGHTGIVSRLRIIQVYGTEIFHTLAWASQKQKRGSYSAYGAEILAVAYVDDRGYYFKVCLNSIFPWMNLSHKLVVDSHGLHDTITTLHDGPEYRLRHTVQRLRNSFETSELDRLSWILGTENVADALAKRNMSSYQKLNCFCNVGSFPQPIIFAYGVDSKTWR